MNTRALFATVFQLFECWYSIKIHWKLNAEYPPYLGVQVQQLSTPEKRDFSPPSFRPISEALVFYDRIWLFPACLMVELYTSSGETLQRYCLSLSPSQPRQKSPTSGHFLVIVIRHEDCSVRALAVWSKSSHAKSKPVSFQSVRVKTGPSLWASSERRCPDLREYEPHTHIHTQDINHQNPFWKTEVQFYTNMYLINIWKQTTYFASGHGLVTDLRGLPRKNKWELAGHSCNSYPLLCFAKNSNQPWHKGDFKCPTQLFYFSKGNVFRSCHQGFSRPPSLHVTSLQPWSGLSVVKYSLPAPFPLVHKLQGHLMTWEWL